ncbi:MAG: 2,5-diamino-6-(ribosylamino)-4(3H)-pyrimidinone 5'-phosphate reductase [Thermoplasmatota archaeon]
MRPVVVVNCAMSADGKIALASRKQTRISCGEDIARVQRLRASCDAILVGIGTVLQDDPSLLVKEALVKRAGQPLRVVLDSRGRTPPGARVLSPEARTIVAATDSAREVAPASNVELLRLGPGPRVPLSPLLDELGRRGVRRLLVEGGEEVIGSFVAERLFDRLIIYVGSVVLGGHGPTPAGGEGARELDEAVRLRLIRVRRVGDGVLLEYEPRERMWAPGG